MAIAAAGLGSISEQQEWTVGRWRAISALLPAHEARQDMRTTHVALMPKLWQHAHQQYQAVWDRWRTIADSTRARKSQGPMASPRGLGTWLKSLFGARIREG